MAGKEETQSNTRIWPKRKTHLDGDELKTRCTACGMQWLVDQALAGYRLRCECGSWVGAPSLPKGPELEGHRQAKRLEYWFDDDSPSEPAFQLVGSERVTETAKHKPKRQAVPEQRIDRGLLELFSWLVIFAIPAFALPELVASTEMTWLPLFSSLGTGLLILLVSARKEKLGPSRIGRAKWRHLAEANLVSYAAAAGAIALTPQIAAGSMLGAGLAALLEHGGLVAGLLGVALLPALLEEIAFRGVLQGRMAQLFGSGSGILLSSVAFALAHGATIYLPAYLLLGLYLAWLRNRSDSLAAPILMHFLFNALLVMGQYFAWGMGGVG